jgi:hypothetical protein
LPWNDFTAKAQPELDALIAVRLSGSILTMARAAGDRHDTSPIA